MFSQSLLALGSAAEISAEEQRKRDLFIQLRAQQQRQASEQAKPSPAPRQAPPAKVTPPQQTPAPRQTQTQTQTQSIPKARTQGPAQAAPAPRSRPSSRPNPASSAPATATRPPQPSPVTRKAVPTQQRPPRPSGAPSSQPQPGSGPATVVTPNPPATRGGSRKEPSTTGFGERLKNFAQATRQRLESLPRTEQSLGTPQQHSLPTRDFDRAPGTVDPSTGGRSKAGPDLVALKANSKPAPKPAPEPFPSQPETEAKPRAEQKSEAEKAVVKKSAPEPGSSSSATSQAGLIASAKRALGDKTPTSGELERGIAHASSAVGRLTEAAAGSGVDLIDLSAGDLEPVAHQVKAITGAEKAKAKAQRTIDATKLQARTDPAAPTEVENSTSLGPVADSPAQAQAQAQSPAASGVTIQPLGMSTFERLALSSIIATESHLAELTEKGDGPMTKPVSTEAGAEEFEESAPPIVIGDTDALEAVINRAPASDISPGLDEMVISSTSQTDFDLNDAEMVFSGNVQVKSPRFNLRADKFIVHLKADQSGMSHGEAIGDVVIELREDGQPTGYTGLADNALYHPGEGKITLSGWPKIRQQFKEHVAVTRDTKMVLYTDGRVKTLGRNRTLIRK